MLNKVLNIPKNLKPLIIILGVLGSLYSKQVSENTFLFCLKSHIEPLNISRNNDSMLIDNFQINKFIVDNNIDNIEEWIPQATDMDHDGDVYLNRIYRVYVSDNNRSVLESLINEIGLLPIVLYSENEYIRKPYYSPSDPMVDVQCSINSDKADKAWDFWNIPEGVIPEG